MQIFKIKVRGFFINVKVKFHCNIEGILNIEVMLAALASMDKKFIMRLWTLNELFIWVTLTKFRTDEIYLKKTSFSPSLCFVEPNTEKEWNKMGDSKGLFTGNPVFLGESVLHGTKYKYDICTFSRLYLFLSKIFFSLIIFSNFQNIFKNIHLDLQHSELVKALV